MSGCEELSQREDEDCRNILPGIQCARWYIERKWPLKRNHYNFFSKQYAKKSILLWTHTFTSHFLIPMQTESLQIHGTCTLCFLLTGNVDHLLSSGNGTASGITEPIFTLFNKKERCDLQKLKVLWFNYHSTMPLTTISRVSYLSFII